MASPTAVPVIKVDGAEVDQNVVDVIDVRVWSSLLESSSAVLHIGDPIFEVLDGDKFAIGKSLEIGFMVESSSVTVFKGEIVAIGAEQRLNRRHECVVEAMDKSHRLSAEATPKTYLDQTWTDIVKKIAGVHSLTPDVGSFTEKHEYVLQTVNDRLFLSRIADAVGAEWYVDDSKLIFKERVKGSAATTLSWNDNLLRLEVRASVTDMVTKVTVRGFDRETQKEINGASTPAGAAVDLGSSAKIATDTFTKGKTFGKNIELIPGAIMTSAEATTAAGAIATDAQAAVLRVTGEAQGTPSIKVGSWLTIEGCGAKLNGDYYITECEHLFGEAQPYRTRFKLTNDHLALRVPPTAAGSMGAAAGFGYAGLVLGQVTNIKDEKASKQRVKVKFPTMPTLESAWARVVVLGGGAKTGIDFRPEVGDEVLVGFEHGDLRLPYVIGGLTSKTADEVSPAVVDGKVALRSLTSRKGHRIEISDNDDDKKQYVSITTADKKTSAVFSQDSITITTKGPSGLTLTDGKAKIILKDGAVTIEGDSVSIKGKSAAVKLEGMTVEAKGSSGVTLDGGAKLEAKGAQVSINGSAMTEIKGAMVKIN